MSAEPWDRGEDLFIRQRLKERCSVEETWRRMLNVGYRRPIEEVTKRCRHIRKVIADEARAAAEVRLRKEDGRVRKEDDPSPDPDLRRQNRAFLKAMMSAD